MQKEQKDKQQESITKGEKIVNRGKQRRRHFKSSSHRNDLAGRIRDDFVTHHWQAILSPWRHFTLNFISSGFHYITHKFWILGSRDFYSEWMIEIRNGIG